MEVVETAEAVEMAVVVVVAVSLTAHMLFEGNVHRIDHEVNNKRNLSYTLLLYY